jgi:rare lipoprotein A
MNQRLFRSLTAAVVMSAVSALPSAAQQADRLEEIFRLSADASDISPDAAANAEEDAPAGGETALEASGSEASQASQSSENLDSATDSAGSTDSFGTAPRTTAADALTRLTRNSDLVRVIAHPLDDRQAATLYVQNIPVLTFVGPELSTLSDNKAATADIGDLATDPAVRATAIAATLDQFYQGEGEATAITVRWDADQEAYVIALADTDLVTIGTAAAVILPDTTENDAVDALQATNRLRRLLGGAEPLAAVAGQPEPTAAAPAFQEVVSVTTGQASWYGPGFHGRRTASGEVFNQNALTAAHRRLPFGTVVRVTNLNNNRQVVVRINDRGPFTGGRVIDLSAGAAREIGLDRAGVGPVRLEVLSAP